MVLVNVIAFAVLKIFHNLVSIQKSLFANNCWNKIRKGAPWDLTFILTELLEKLNSFVKIRLVLEIKNIASFIKTRFSLKGGCTKMRKHAETFHANKGCKMTIVFFIPVSRFSKKKKKQLRCNFQTLFARKRGPAHFYILYSILSYFITSSWLKAPNVFFPHINKCISLQRRI